MKNKYQNFLELILSLQFLNHCHIILPILLIIIFSLYSVMENNKRREMRKTQYKKNRLLDRVLFKWN